MLYKTNLDERPAPSAQLKWEKPRSRFPAEDGKERFFPLRQYVFRYGGASAPTGLYICQSWWHTSRF